MEKNILRIMRNIYEENNTLVNKQLEKIPPFY